MEYSKIEWTDHTFNPWIGCTKVSPGCQNCYAETLAKRFKKAEWGKGKERVITSEANWKKPLSWDRKAQKDGVRRKVFCASMADVFDEEIEDKLIDYLFCNAINKTKSLDWLILTKRIERAEKYFDFFPEQLSKNILLGVSICTQKEADKKIPILLDIKKRTGLRVFLSMEPLLEEIKLRYIDYGEKTILPLTGLIKPSIGYPIEHEKIDWVIVGGESGHNARPMNPDWVRSIRDECEYEKVPFFFKQWGEWITYSQLIRNQMLYLTDFSNKTGKFVDEKFISGSFKGDADCYYHLGTHRSGSMLDGKEHKEFYE